MEKQLPVYTALPTQNVQGYYRPTSTDLPLMRPDSLPRLWRYINLLLTYLLTLSMLHFTVSGLITCNSHAYWRWR